MRCVRFFGAIVRCRCIDFLGGPAPVLSSAGQSFFSSISRSLFGALPSSDCMSRRGPTRERLQPVRLSPPSDVSNETRLGFPIEPERPPFRRPSSTPVEPTRVSCSSIGWKRPQIHHHKSVASRARRARVLAAPPSWIQTPCHRTSGIETGGVVGTGGSVVTSVEEDQPWLVEREKQVLVWDKGTDGGT